MDKLKVCYYIYEERPVLCILTNHFQGQTSIWHLSVDKIYFQGQTLDGLRVTE